MLQEGQQVGEYIIEAEIGGGGMAKVYRARHSVLDTKHALKVLDPKYRANPEARKRFLDEAKIQAKHLNHRNIVKVTNIVATSEVAALVMDLVTGGNLEGLIEARRKPVSADEFMALAVPILEAIGHAHEEGIVHRDIKPANVLLQEKNGTLVPMLTDFGIAKVGDKLSSKKKSTHADARMGTLAYMSPEQIRQAKNVTARSDIFSIGAMFYELATGQVPFDGDSDFDIMQAIVQGTFKDPSALAKVDQPPHVIAAIRRAMDPDPDKRFATCGEFIDALGGKASVAAPVRAITQAGAGGGRRWGLFAVLALLAAGAGGAAVYLATRGGDEPRYDELIGAVSDAGAGTELAAAPGVRRVVDRLPPDAAPPPPPDAAPPPPPPPDAAPPKITKPPPRPARPACLGRWSGGGKSLAIKRSSGTCGTVSVKVGTMTCSGDVYSCRASGSSFNGSFRCNYDKLKGNVYGSLRMTCTGSSGRVTMTTGGKNQYWSLKKH